MLEKLHNLSPVMRRYLVIGISVYLFELVVIFVAGLFHASNLVAVGLSFWLGLIVSFGLQKIVTFRDRRLHHKVLIPQLVAYTLVVLFNFGFTLFVAHLLARSVTPFGARTLALTVTTLWNFYLYKTRIFQRGDSEYAKVVE